MSVERIVGIDFGTSTSVIRVKRYKDGQPIDDRLSKTDVVFGNGSPMVPTLIQKTSKGTYFGYEAEIPKERRETLYQNFKINLESDDSAEKAEARELTEEFFSYLGKVYNAQSEGGYLGEHTDTERTIVSYPVKWSDETKRFMIDAAKKAGFKNVEGMDEAQAAIHAVTVQYENLLTKNKVFKYNIPCNILLVDMGAGTTDLVMCRHTPGNNAKTEILCTWPLSGDILFGGREVDEKLIEYVKGLMPEDSPMTEGIIKKVGIKEFKSWKETVVSPALQRGETVETFSKVDDIAELMELEIDPYDIDRLSFESYLADYLRKLPQLINGCIDRSGLKNNDIDLVILTGGHSQWYFVEKMLKENPVINIPKIKNDPNRILKITRPQETVALGMVFKPLSVEIKEDSTDDSTAQGSTSGTTPYRMYIEDVFEVTNYGYVICGLGKGGVLKIGDRINILDGNKPVANAIVDGIEMYKKTLKEANDGQAVGIGVKFYNGISPDQWKGLNLVSGGTADGSAERPHEHVDSQSGTNTDEQPKTEDDIFKYYQKNLRNLVAVWNGWFSGYSGSNTQYAAVRQDGTVISNNSTAKGWRNVKQIGAGSYYSACLFKDGRVATINLGGTENWKNIVKLAFGSYHLVGLKSDGTVVAVGDNGYGNCNVSNWKNIKDIKTTYGTTIGITNDGRVVAVGNNEYGQCNTGSWRNIVSVEGSNLVQTFGITKDGRVFATGRNDYGQCNTKSWVGIKQILSNGRQTFGITKNNKFYFTGGNDDELDLNGNGNSGVDVSSIGKNLSCCYKDLSIIWIKPDGTLDLLNLDNNHGVNIIADWKDIFAIAFCDDRLIGLERNGTIHYTNYSTDYKSLFSMKLVDKPADSVIIPERLFFQDNTQLYG